MLPCRGWIELAFAHEAIINHIIYKIHFQRRLVQRLKLLLQDKVSFTRWWILFERELLLRAESITWQELFMESAFTRVS